MRKIGSEQSCHLPKETTNKCWSQDWNTGPFYSVKVQLVSWASVGNTWLTCRCQTEITSGSVLMFWINFGWCECERGLMGIPLSSRTPLYSICPSFFYMDIELSVVTMGLKQEELTGELNVSLQIRWSDWKLSSHLNLHRAALEQ